MYVSQHNRDRISECMYLSLQHVVSVKDVFITKIELLRCENKNCMGIECFKGTTKLQKVC